MRVQKCRTWWIAASTWLLVPAVLHAEQPDYLKDIKPILTERCVACHGTLRQQGGLRLDAAPLIARGGESGAVVVSGKSAESVLIQRIAEKDESLRMPPEGEALKPEQIELFRRWIDAGAQLPEETIPATPAEHWAFQTVEQPQPPEASAPWVRNEIDRFVAAQHAKLGLKAVEEVAPGLLLRRAYLDLTGLPPTRAELASFLADTSPGAYERAVDRLLESPRYGERWARHWMDVWRYSDPSGYGNEIRDSRHHIWRWRDWIIESLNADQGYDQMIVQMLAADEAVPGDLAAQRATGFLARNWYKFNRNVWLDNIVEHSSKAFLGITMNCAKCHDHKYDPIDHAEYYQIRAIFESHDVRDDPFGTADDSLVRAYDAHPDTKTFVFLQGDENRVDEDHAVTPEVPGFLGAELSIEPVRLPLTAYYPALAPENYQATLAAKQAELAKATEAVEALTKKDGKPDELELPVTQARVDTLTAELASLAARHAAESVKYELAQGDQPRLALAAAGAERSAALKSLEEKRLVQQKTLADAQTQQSANKKEGKPEDANLTKSIDAANKQIEALDKQIADAQAKLDSDDPKYSPLGKVYSATSTGRRLAYARWIASPQNPLTARVLVNHVWLRHFDTPLVERMFDFGLRSPRPEFAELLDWLAADFMQHNWSMKHLHRQLVTSGLYRLSTSQAAAAPENLSIDQDNLFYWRMNARRLEAEVVRDSVLHLGGSLDLTPGGSPVPFTQGQSVLRRSIFFQQDKERQMTFLSLFDGANVNECYRRKPTVVPQQALAMYNSEIAANQAEKLAAALPHETSPEFVTAIFKTVLCRPPSAEERSECESFLAQIPDAARGRQHLALVLLNHNDFVTAR